MDRKKILVVNWRDMKNPEAGGAEVHLHEVFRRVAAMGHDVTFVSHYFANAKRRETVDGMQILRYGEKYTFNLSLPLVYLFMLRKENFDVIIDCSNKVPLLMPLYTRRPLVPIVNHLFGDSIRKEVFFPLSFYIRTFERLIPIVYRHKTFIVGSGSDKEHLLQLGAKDENIVSIPYGVDDELYHPGQRKTEQPSFIYLGRLKKYKSIDVLIRAMKVIVEKMPGARLDIVGKGDNLPHLEQLVAELHLEQCVHFRGFVSEQEKVRLLQEAWVAVQPSIKEGFGLTVVEANACGTPVVASDAPGLREAVAHEKTGFLVEYGNVEEFTQKTLELLSNEDLRRTFSQNAIEWAKGFSWKRAAEDTVSVIDRCQREWRS